MVPVTLHSQSVVKLAMRLFATEFAAGSGSQWIVSFPLHDLANT